MYRLWLSEGTMRAFIPVKPTDPASLCEACKAGRLHDQAHCPKQGDKRKRVHEPGVVGKAARNRVPPPLAAHLARAMKQAWEEADSTMREAKGGAE